MRLYILASGKDAKGTQLEYLTKTILESLGYEYVATNQIASGGDEIDVFAKRVIPQVGKVKEYPLICECKAHESPITMNDWEKFLGKVYNQKQSNDSTEGLMIALSDANGNVKGDYEQSKYRDVQLIRGNELIGPLSKAFHLDSEVIARTQIQQLTNQTVTSIDLVLFEKDIYWLFVFANGQFSLFDKNYKSLNEEQESSLLPILSQYSPHQISSYKNVRQEYDLLQRRNYVSSVISWRILKGAMVFQDAISDVVFMTKGGVVPEMKDVEEVMQTIPFAEVDFENHKATLKSPESIDYPTLYRFLLLGPLPVSLYNDFYKQNINESLLNEICEIQFGLSLTAEDKLACLFVLQHSPSALQYALTPDVLIRSGILIDGGNGGKSARNHFVEQILSRFESDIKGNGHVMVFDKLGMRDFRKSVSMSFVGIEGTKYDISTDQRLFAVPVPGTSTFAVVQAIDGFKGEYDKQRDTVIPHDDKSKGIIV